MHDIFPLQLLRERADDARFDAGIKLPPVPLFSLVVVQKQPMVEVEL
jgi:hypothetical protein